MKRRARVAAALALGWALGLAGCAGTGGMRLDEGGDATGELGQIKPVSNPADVYIQLAVEYLRNNTYSVALQNAKKAVIVSPDYATAHNVLGVVYQRIGEREQAEKHFRKAVALDPRDPFALNAYGGFLCAGKRFDEADAMFRRALENPLYQTPWVALTNAGMCAAQAGRRDQAEAYLRKGLQANGKFAPALLKMADISYEQGNMLSARAYLQRYAEVAEPTAESLWLGIRAERALGDRDQEASYSLLLRARYPDSNEVQLLNESRTP
jgi:type IV pilus assembly protein PilF